MSGGNSVSIQNNSSNTLSLTSNGSFTFSTTIQSGSTYSITVLSNPTNQNCIITNGSGTVSSSNITNIEINCTGNASGPLVSGTIINNLTLTGGVTTFVGGTCAANSTCTGSQGYANSPSTVLFNNPEGITTDGYYLYIVDRGNNRIRRVQISDGTTITFAGSGSNNTTDGIGTTAEFNAPRVITTDGINLYVSQTGGDCIRKISIS
ncbi:MAG: hypothetical protein KDK36_13630, partial [Leptospiraceae bacterium]|nr:hypothetical protein [Leptospiraceae bacterium]